jgi:hypothetical protein
VWNGERRSFGTNILDAEIEGSLFSHYKKRILWWWTILTPSLKKWDLKIILNLYYKLYTVGAG